MHLNILLNDSMVQDARHAASMPSSRKKHPTSLPKGRTNHNWLENGPNYSHWLKAHFQTSPGTTETIRHSHLVIAKTGTDISTIAELGGGMRGSFFDKATILRLSLNH